jgi:CHAT domain-containing protein
VQAGAGAFIGTSWPVREMPAAAFSEAFYDTLLKHRPLADAASEGRAAAKALGDASWLAYTVYGQPAARIADG